FCPRLISNGMKINNINCLKTTAVIIWLSSFLAIPVTSYAYAETAYYGYGEVTYYGQVTYYAYAYAQGAYGLFITASTSFGGNLTVRDNLSKGSGSFVIDHPLDPKNKLLYHSFVESPDVKNIYDGVITLDEKGEAIVVLPSYFEALNKDFRYQVKPILQSAPNLYIKREVRNNQFTVAGGNPGQKISWQVTGIRHDPFILKYPIKVEVKKGSDTLVGKGEYLHKEAYGAVKDDINPLKDLFQKFRQYWPFSQSP
ncbi:MAG: hypothetical protein Q8R36_01830, partial [bacterium]|nr:hypothetical protein [bacterium]